MLRVQQKSTKPHGHMMVSNGAQKLIIEFKGQRKLKHDLKEKKKNTHRQRPTSCHWKQSQLPMTTTQVEHLKKPGNQIFEALYSTDHHSKALSFQTDSTPVNLIT